MGIAILEGKGTVFGTAEQGSVLASKTFSSKAAGINKQGTIAELGDLSWAPSTGVDKTVSPGYYTGGTLSTKNAYNAGFNAKTLHRVSIGSSNTLTSHTFNVSAMLNNYKTLSVDDFEIVATGISYTLSESNNPGTQQTLSKSYDADNGVLTISNCLSNIHSDNYGKLAYVKTYIEYSIYVIF